MIPTERVRAKTARAREHLRYLTARVTTFTHSHHCELSCRDDLQSGDRTFCVEEEVLVPVDIPLVVGDVVHNLRSALDHMVHELVLAAGNTPTTNTEFPVCTTAAKFGSERPQLQLRGVTAASKTAIEACQPYASPDTPLLDIHRLDIIDKHRGLLLCPCSTREIRFPGNCARLVAPAADAIGEHISSLSFEWVRLRVGQPLFTISRPFDEDVKPCIPLDIALAEPDAPQRDVILPALEKMVEFVDDLINRFATLLT